MNYADKLTQATLEVFEMMVPLAITPEAPLQDENAEMASHVSAMLGLSGDFAGIVTIHCNGQVACEVTSAMLGMEVEDIDDDVKDAVGEVANMVAGGLKVSLAEEEVDVELAIPSVVAGKAFRISAPTGTRRTVIPFRTPAGHFWVELKFRLGC